MRTNLPVSQQEHRLPAGVSLVSTTDLNSHITYVNPAFIQVSGFSRDELIGQPHNLVRHPDMPSEAFRDLWATVQSGRPWSACVKNRRKNGDHYWVLANVTPIVRDGEVVGYMSVRTLPSRAQIDEAEALYARLREQQAQDTQHLALNGGQVRATGLLTRAFAALRPGLRGRVMTGVIGAAVANIVVSESLITAPGALRWSVTAGMLAATALYALWLAQRIGQPIAMATAAATRIAAGDLTQDVPTAGNDEMGLLMRAVNQLNVNLRGIVGDVRREVGEIAIATREVAAGSQDLSQRTETQSSNLEQTAAAMEQLDSTVRKNAESTRTVTGLARNAGQVAGEGKTAMDDAIATMQAVSTTSSRISDIIQVVESISFQTNILALNAAVEAARAGEQGRGFAVVATEVRHLAHRTADAAKEIKSLIDESVAGVDAGTRAVQHAGGTIGEIVGAVERMSMLMGEMSTATDQQAIGITQVNQAVGQLDGLTQQNAALVEQSSAAASLMHRKAEELKQAVQVFHLAE
ncbi:MAG: methyl-accepting chemotaxis protein [Burkholderiales bacterium]